MGRVFDHFGIAVASKEPVRECIRIAKLAEESGIGSFWITESFYFRSAIAGLMAVASETDRIPLGLAVISIFSRHPSIIAMEAATVDEYANGRFLLGLGASVISVEREGAISLKPVTSMRETVEIVRSLLKQNLVTYEGKIHYVRKSHYIEDKGGSLNFAPFRSQIPIYLGVEGPKLLELAGEIGDGVILTNPSTGSHVRYARKHVAQGAARAGRSVSDIKICGLLTFSIGRNSRKAKDATREMVASYMKFLAGDWSGVLETMGVSLEEARPFVDAIAKKGLKYAAMMVTDELLDKLVVAGTPDECLEKLQDLAEAGLDIPIAYSIFGPNREEAIKLIGEEVIGKI